MLDDWPCSHKVGSVNLRDKAKELVRMIFHGQESQEDSVTEKHVRNLLVTQKIEREVHSRTLQTQPPTPCSSKDKQLKSEIVLIYL